MSQAPAQQVTPETKVELAGLILENAVQFLTELWISVWSLEIETKDEETKKHLHEIRQRVSRQIDVLSNERGMFAEPSTEAVFH